MSVGQVVGFPVEFSVWGDSWEKLKKEFTEVRALAWVPN